MLWQFFSLPGIENGIEYRYFQGIVSKLEIPVSWQHYSVHTQTFSSTEIVNITKIIFMKNSDSILKGYNNVVIVYKVIKCAASQ